MSSHWNECKPKLLSIAARSQKGVTNDGWGLGSFDGWICYDIAIENALCAKRVQCRSLDEILMGTILTLKETQDASWTDTFVNLWIAALRTIQRSKLDPSDAPLEPRISVLLSSVPSAVNRATKLPENTDISITLAAEAQKKGILASLRLLDSFPGLILAPAGWVSTLVDITANDIIPGGANRAGTLRDLLVEALILEGVLSQSEGISVLPSGPVGSTWRRLAGMAPAPKVLPGSGINESKSAGRTWARLLPVESQSERVQLTVTDWQALAADSAMSFDQVKQAYGFVTAGDVDGHSRSAAVAAICGSTLHRSWSIQPEVISLVVRVLSPNDGEPAQASPEIPLETVTETAPELWPEPAQEPATELVQEIEPDFDFSLEMELENLPEPTQEPVQEPVLEPALELSSQTEKALGYPFSHLLKWAPVFLPVLKAISQDSVFVLLSIHGQLAHVAAALLPIVEAYGQLSMGANLEVTGGKAVFALASLLLMRITQQCILPEDAKIDTVSAGQKRKRNQKSPSVRRATAMELLCLSRESREGSFLEASALPKWTQFELGDLSWVSRSRIGSPFPTLPLPDPETRPVADLLLSAAFRSRKVEDSKVSFWEAVLWSPDISRWIMEANSMGKLSNKDSVNALHELVNMCPAVSGPLGTFLTLELLQGTWNSVLANGTDWPMTCPDLVKMDTEMQSNLLNAGIEKEAYFAGDSTLLKSLSIPLPLAIFAGFAVSLKGEYSQWIWGVVSGALELMGGFAEWPVSMFLGSLIRTKTRNPWKKLMTNITAQICARNDDTVLRLVEGCFAHALRPRPRSAVHGGNEELRVNELRTDENYGTKYAISEKAEFDRGDLKRRFYANGRSWFIGPVSGVGLPEGAGRLFGSGSDFIERTVGHTRTLEPGALFLNAAVLVNDVEFVGDRILKLVADSVSAIGLSKSVLPSNVTTKDLEQSDYPPVSLRCRFPSLSSGILQAIDAANLGSGLLVSLGGQSLVKKLLEHSIPQLLQSIREDSILVGFVTARLAVLSLSLSFSDYFGQRNDRRCSILSTHLGFLVSGFAASEFLAKKRNTFKSYALEFLAYVTVHFRHWVEEVELELVEKVVSLLLKLNEDSLAMAFCDSAGARAVDLTAKIALSAVDIVVM